jgi:hypothetical protein
MSQFTKSFLWRFILDIILHLIGMKIFYLMMINRLHRTTSTL